jgi:hypothetical protein
LVVTAFEVDEDVSFESTTKEHDATPEAGSVPVSVTVTVPPAGMDVGCGVMLAPSNPEPATDQVTPEAGPPELVRTA